MDENEISGLNVAAHYCVDVSSVPGLLAFVEHEIICSGGG